MVEKGATAVCIPWEELPKAVRALKLCKEKEAVEAIVAELRKKLAINLDPTPVIDRWPGEVTRSSSYSKSFLVVGSSHASKLAVALKDRGQRVELIFEANLRAMKSKIVALATSVEKVMEEKQVDCIMFAVADNNIYLAMYNEETSPALKDNDGNFHVCGDLILSSKSAQHSLFNSLKPVFDKVRNKHVLFMSPLPRYIISGCCNDAKHMANRSQPGFEMQLLKDLKDTAENFKDFMFMSGYKNMKVLDPCINIRNLGEEELWETDPVHHKIADSAVWMASNMEAAAATAGNKRPRTDSAGLGASRRTKISSREGDGGSTSNSGGSGRGGHRGGGYGGRAIGGKGPGGRFSRC
jgi:uncharacterized membrane protein YgcG